MFVGDLEGVALALKQLGAKGPFLDTYPDAVQPFLRRRVWCSSLLAARTSVDESGAPLFVKPKDRSKRFTGFVYTSHADEFRFEGASERMEVYCSTPVRFIREYRAYIVDGALRGMCQYSGEPGPPPDDAFISDVVDALRATNQSVAGFALDVGLLDDGQPAVVECNEGFGLGLYPGLAEESYVDLLVRRWEELMLAPAHSG
jgi:ATP-grasp domain, R2K clade family 2